MCPAKNSSLFLSTTVYLYICYIHIIMHFKIIWSLKKISSSGKHTSLVGSSLSTLWLFKVFIYMDLINSISSKVEQSEISDLSLNLSRFSNQHFIFHYAAFLKVLNLKYFNLMAFLLQGEETNKYHNKNLYKGIKQLVRNAHFTLAIIIGN